MIDPTEALAPASPDDLATALAFALRFGGHKRVHDADEIMAVIVVKRLVAHLGRARRDEAARGRRRSGAGPRLRRLTNYWEIPRRRNCTTSA